MEQSPVQYHRAAQALHWLLAALLSLQFALGLRLESITALLAQFNAYQWHKSIGILILVLSVLRLALRYLLPRPPAADSGAKGFAAKLVHTLLYVVMIGGPLTGWMLVSTAKIKVPTVLFALLPWPHLPIDPAFHGLAKLGHAVLAWLLPALIALHLAGAIWHWRLRDGVAERMLPSQDWRPYNLISPLLMLGICAYMGSSALLPNFWSFPAAQQDAPVSSAKVASASPAPVQTDAASPADEFSPSPSESESAAPLSADWRVLAGSRLGFTTSYAGTAINGTFGSWRAAIQFDPEDLPKARIKASIALGSVGSGDAERDGTLKGPGFFDAGLRPTATFTAAGFERLGKDRYAARGVLSLNGVNRPVRLVFTLRISGNRAKAQGSAQISRLAFKVGQDEWESTDQIPDAVGVTFSINAERK